MFSPLARDVMLRETRAAALRDLRRECEERAREQEQTARELAREREADLQALRDWSALLLCLG